MFTRVATKGTRITKAGHEGHEDHKGFRAMNNHHVLRVLRGYRFPRAGYFVAACAMVGSVSVVAQGVPWPAELAPARVGLGIVPLPPIDVLEPPVTAHLQEARQEFEVAVARRGRADAELADAYGALGRVFHAYEFFEAAEACYRNASRLRPTDVRWLHLRGYLYQQSGRLEEAVDLYLAALRSAPDDPAAIIRLGETYLGLGRTNVAREQFQAALARYPAAASAALGDVALREGRHKDAVQHLEAALERIPSATSLHYSLAMAYRGLGRLDEARAHLERRGPGGIRVVDPIVDLLQTLVRGERLLVIQGRRAYEAGQFQDAANAFSRAIGVAPGSVSARVNLAAALSQLGNIAGAVEHLRVAVEQAPGEADVSRALVGALVRLEREDEAIEVLTRTRAFIPDDEETLLSLSILLAHQGRYQEAVGRLEDGYRRFPDRTRTATTLARLLASSPNLSLRDGRRALDLAMAVYESSPSPVHGETVALALAELGRCADALEWMSRAVTGAEQAKEVAEVVRLRGETSKYETAPCRPGR